MAMFSGISGGSVNFQLGNFQDLSELARIRPHFSVSCGRLLWNLMLFNLLDLFWFFFFIINVCV